MLELIDVSSEVPIAPPPGRTPLVVDLDGTLIRSELLIESGFELAGRNPSSFAGAALALRRGKAQLKDYLAARIALDPSKLPYNEAVLNCIRAARASGRPVFLTSASNERFVAAIASHLGLFNGWFASDQTTDLSNVNKASRLVLAFGKGGFEYIGSGEDIPVWAVSAGGIAVGASARLQRKLAASGPNTEYFLWLICPILTCILLLAQRRHVIGDPIAFAMREWIAAAIFIAEVIIAAPRDRTKFSGEPSWKSPAELCERIMMLFSRATNDEANVVASPVRRQRRSSTILMSI